MKKYILFFVSLLVTFSVKAQEFPAENSSNYYDFGIGGGVSVTRGYTNVAKQNNNLAAHLSVIYNYSMFVRIEAEMQYGRLSGGGLLPSQDIYGRVYVNNYLGVNLHGDFQLEQAMKAANIIYDEEASWFLYNVVRNCRIGTGLGFVINNNSVQRYSIYTPPYPQTGYYKFPGSDKSINLMLPLRFGYEFKFFDDFGAPRMALDMEYIHNIVPGSGLDGYNDPQSKFKHNHVDQYRQIGLKLIYFIGGQ